MSNNNHKILEIGSYAVLTNEGKSVYKFMANAIVQIKDVIKHTVDEKQVVCYIVSPINNVEDQFLNQQFSIMDVFIKPARKIQLTTEEVKEILDDMI